MAVAIVPGTVIVEIGPSASKQEKTTGAMGEEVPDRDSGEKREGEGRREGEETARTLTPIYVFHLRMNTTQHRRGMSQTRGR